MWVRGESDHSGTAYSRDFLSVQTHLFEMKMDQSTLAHRKIPPDAAHFIKYIHAIVHISIQIFVSKTEKL